MNILHTFKIILSNDKEKEIAIRRPTRREIDEADMVNSAYISDCISRGILTKEMLLKRYKDFGGALSEDEMRDYRALLKEMIELNKKIQKTKSVKRKEALEKELAAVFDGVQDIEQTQEDLFGRTAEIIARNKTILWLAFLLAIDPKSEQGIFDGLDHEERYEAYSKMEESDFEDSQLLIEKICLYVAFWYSNRGVGKQDFEALDVYLREDEEPKKDEPEDSTGDK